MTSEKKSDNLGPTITVSATVNGVSTETLVDTGSPVTILSLKFAMSVLSQAISINRGMKNGYEKEIERS